MLSLWEHSGRSTVGFYEFGSVLQAHNVTWQHTRSKMLGRDWLPMCSRSRNPFVISRPSPPLTCVSCHGSPHVNPLNVGRIQGLVWGKGHLQLLYTLYVCVCVCEKITDVITIVSLICLHMNNSTVYSVYEHGDFAHFHTEKMSVRAIYKVLL